jgi:signal transduction histidine kinase
MTRRWVPRGLTLRGRLTLVFGAVFLVGGVLLVALTTTLANRSIAEASASSAPAAAELQQRLGDIIAAAQRGTAPSAQGSPTAAPSKLEGKAQTPEQAKAANLKQQLVAANSDYSAATKTDAIDRLVTESLVGAAILLPAAGLLAWGLAGRSLRPVRSITEAARQTSADRLSNRLALTGPRDEITELADTFDAMMERLQHAFDAQRRFVADASHELRTPLAVAATSIDVVLAKPDRRPEQLEAMAVDVRGALTRAERLVDSLLALTRSEHLDHAREPVDLAILVEDALDARRAGISAGQLTVSTELGEARTVGDPALLERMVGNLVDNAVRHNVDHGHVTLRTSASEAGVVLTIANTGVTIPEELLPQLLEPFHRLHGRARTADQGLGLGLTIAAAASRAHRGKLSLTAVPSGGLEVRVALPSPSNQPGRLPVLKSP